MVQWKIIFPRAMCSREDPIYLAVMVVQMASQWHSLVSQKLFLAKTLLAQLEQAEFAPGREAITQGSIELTLRGRKLLLVMIARLYQHKSATPGNLEELEVLLGADVAEVNELQQLARQGGSWWNHLDQLEARQSQPPAPKKTVSDDNIIAVTAEKGPDCSAAALNNTLAEIKQFTDHLEEQHSEW